MQKSLTHNKLSLQDKSTLLYTMPPSHDSQKHTAFSSGSPSSDTTNHGRMSKRSSEGVNQNKKGKSFMRFTSFMWKQPHPDPKRKVTEEAIIEDVRRSSHRLGREVRALTPVQGKFTDKLFLYSDDTERKTFSHVKHCSPDKKSSLFGNFFAAKCSTSVDQNFSTSVDKQTFSGYGLQFSSASDRKITSYIDKRFASVNDKRISYFYGRKKTSMGHDKNSFITDDTMRLCQSMSSASFSECKFQSMKKAGTLHMPVRLRNFLDEITYVDTLHLDAFTQLKCNSQRCLGAVKSELSSPDPPRKREDIISHAMDFLDQFYFSIAKASSSEHKARAQKVQVSIMKHGTYEMTRYELTFGAKQAWRNAHRCIGRLHWAKLQVLDARGALTAKDMFVSLCHHIRYATNKGNIQSTITIFPQHIEDREDYRIWNSYLISYAAYLLEDGTIAGDPKNLEFTEECTKLGWQPKHGHFDILPIVVSVPGNDPQWFDIPEDLVLEVDLSHPEHRWFSDLGLKWFALPIISGMKLDCGGLIFPACAFNGWFMGTQIGCRCLCDPHRYNIVPTLISKMSHNKYGLLTIDKAVLEVNEAVLHSFLKAKVAIVDHHSCSNSFLYHLDNEYKSRGGCPADWTYIVPPLTTSMLGVFHQEMLMYLLKPSFEHQDEAWLTYNWRSPGISEVSVTIQGQKKSTERSTILLLRLSPEKLSTKVKCVILFATETGMSERLARILSKIFQYAFDVEVISMSQYCVELLAHESLVLIVTSTQGSGEPPFDGQEMAKTLFEKRDYVVIGNTVLTTAKSYKTYVQMCSYREKTHMEASELFEASDFLQNVRFSVFSLIAENFPHCGAFGKYLNNIFQELGADKIYPIEVGDVHFGLEDSFYKWAAGVYKEACDAFHIDNVKAREVEKITNIEEHKWNPLVCRLRPVPTESDRDLCKKLSYTHQKKIMPCIVMERTQLRAKISSRQTLLLKLNTQNAEEMEYEPGDLVGIFPTNSAFLVEGVMKKLENSPPPEEVVQVELLDTECQGEIKKWIPFEKLPPCSLRMALTHFIDLVTPPSRSLLHILSKLANIGNDKEQLEQLAKNQDSYEQWKSTVAPNFLEILNMFPSLKVPAALLLTELPIVHERYYCVSSDPSPEAGDLHITVSVLKYRNSAGNLREGVCSGWLNSCEIGTMLPCLIRKNDSFRLPSNKSLPVLMIAAGKGIAPFRAFWQHRLLELEHFSKAAEDEREILGDMILFFGCRSSALDNIYGKELKLMEKSGVLNYYLALSEEPNVCKMHVQQLVKLKSSLVVDLIINKEGHVYVSGDIVKVNNITSALEEVLSESGQMAPAEAVKYMWSLKDSGVYHEIVYGFDPSLDDEKNLTASILSNTSDTRLDNERLIEGKCCPCVIL